MHKVLKSVIVLIVIAIISLLIYGIYYYWPKEISRQIPGVIYQLGEDNRQFALQTTVQIEGTLNRNLFKNSELTGSFRVVGDEDLEPYEHYTLHSSKLKGSKMWSLYYIDFSGGSIKTFMYGDMYANDDLTELSIQKLKINEHGTGGSWGGDNGFMLAAPAYTREEAVTISKKYTKDNVSW